MTNQPPMIAGRIKHVRDICMKAIDFDNQGRCVSSGWTDRQWLAESVLNILDGKIDEQIANESRPHEVVIFE